MYKRLRWESKSRCRANLGAFAFWLLTLCSCLKSEDFAGLQLQPLEPTLAFALLTTEVHSDDLVDLLDSMYSIQDDGVFRLEFEAERFVQTAAELLPGLDFNLPVPILDTVTSIPLPPLPGFQVQIAELLGDALVFTLNSNIADSVFVTVEIPVLAQNDKIFKETFIIPPAGGPQATFRSSPISISGYTLDLTSGILQLRYSARTRSGNAVRLPLSFMEITGLDFGFVQGGLRRIAIPSGLQTVPIDLPDSLLSGDISFLRPKLRFSIANSVGVPVAIRALQMYVTQIDGSRTPIESVLFDQPLVVDYPALADRGSTVFQEIILDQTNSNIAAVLKPSVRELAFEVEVIANPEDSRRVDFFLTDTSAASLQASLEIPLDVHVSEVKVSYNLPVQIDTIENVEALQLKLYVENGIPLSFAPDLTFTGPGTSIGLVEQSGSEIRAARADAQGHATEVSVSELYFIMPTNQLDLLPRIDSVRLQLEIRGGNGSDGRVQITQGQVMKVGLGATIELGS